MRRRDWWDFHNTVVETKRKAMVIALLEEKSEKIPAERSRTTVSLCTEFFFSIHSGTVQSLVYFGYKIERRSQKIDIFKDFDIFRRVPSCVLDLLLIML